MKLMIASKNKDKIAEIAELLKDIDVELVSAVDFPEIPDVIEDKDSIEGNAIKKATEIADFTGMLTMADDTGLFVKSLNGAPGIYSARYAGEDASYEDNRKKMLAEMKNHSDRSAYFLTVIALAIPNKLIGICEGKVIGQITDKEIGNKGFGYDSIFLAKETGKTFGEMSSEEKHIISHRGRALQNFKPILKNYLQNK